MGKNCSHYRVHKVKCDGQMYARTHKSTHSLTKPPTNRRVTITPPTLLRGDKNVLKFESDPEKNSVTSI